MYYAMKDDFQLLCWEKRLTGIIFSRETGAMQKVEYEDFRLLVLSDGLTDFTGLLGQKKIAHLEKFVDNGILTKSEYPICVRDDWFQLYNNRCVTTVHWSITGRCNYRCRHCMMDAPSGRLGEADTTDMLSLIDEMADAGIRYIDITGGEPLLRKDFLLLVDKLTSRGIKIISIATNGSLINQSMFDCLKKNKQQPKFFISFDGIEGWHNWMRGVNDAEQSFRFAVELCKQNRVPVTATLCLHKGNHNLLSSTIRMLKQCGVDKLEIGGITHSPRWNKYSEGNQMTDLEYLDACLEYIDEYYAEGCPIRLSIGGLASFEEKTGRYEYKGIENSMNKTLSDYVCNDLRTSCYITPDLRLLPCIGMTESNAVFEYPTIKECGGFGQALDHPLYLRTTTTTICDFLEHNTECDACDYRVACHGGCRACAMAENDGDFWAKASWNCMLWKNGYPKRISERLQAVYDKYKKNTYSETKPT